jgi:hypothetical protein
MAKTLIVVAGAGFAIAVICFGLAAALDGAGWAGSSLFTACGPATEDGISGNRRESAWDGEDRVSINMPATVHYRPDAGPRAIVTGPPEALGHLRIVNGDIGSNCRGLLHGQKVDIVLPGVRLQEFRVNGAARLMLENIDQPELTLTIRGAGDVRATGKANDLTLRVTGAGKADLGKLSVSRAEIHITGAGEAEIAPEQEADINITGAGEIRLLKQPPKLQSQIRGAGRIINAPNAR